MTHLIFKLFEIQQEPRDRAIEPRFRTKKGKMDWEHLWKIYSKSEAKATKFFVVRSVERINAGRSVEWSRELFRVGRSGGRENYFGSVGR